ncbi:hypothetical protein [Devosia aurantiaca]|uniref:Uncharacterized protein n=1 Tax=Devosia aurantiaca TaxID=2714858 RepID=A0A6M1SRJ1_9HYPH|nr:hypothetical protein [Devosia aurantiaca]NGP17815.1 hypothetical protein [Devosia aurantiaca]
MSADFQVVQLPNSFESLGLVLDLLSKSEPFMLYELGKISAAIRMQLRHQHHFATIREKRLCGYLGWLPTDADIARTWSQDDGPLTPIFNRPTDAVALTVVITSDPSLTRSLIRAARDANKGKRTYFKRETGVLAVGRKSSVMNL